MLELFRLHILSFEVILNMNKLQKNFVSKFTLFSMGVSSGHNSAKPRPQTRRPTTHEESEYLIEIQKFFTSFSLLLPNFFELKPN
jgi:hypothetical protein